jgi:hypothetical protein
MPTTNLNETQLYEEYNQLTSFEILNQSQELIQDLVHKTSDIILTLRASLNSFLYGEQGTYQARKAKIEELFRNLESTFSRLRVAGSVINQRKIAIDQRKLEEKISNTELDLRPFEVEVRFRFRVFFITK